VLCKKDARSKIFLPELSKLFKYLRDLCLVLAALALEGVVPQVGNGNEAAEVAHVHAVRIRHL
jgi:hypothetical protein